MEEFIIADGDKIVSNTYKYKIGDSQFYIPVTECYKCEQLNKTLNHKSLRCDRCRKYIKSLDLET